MGEKVDCVDVGRKCAETSARKIAWTGKEQRLIHVFGSNVNALK